jgi:hypothetical protein
MTAFLRGLAILAIALNAGVAAAGTLAPDKIAAVTKASDDFAKMAAPARQSGTPPRSTQPAAKALIDTVFDLTPLRAAEPLPLSDLGRLNEWNKAIITVGTVYIFAGTGVADPSQAAANPELVQKVEKNTVDFAPEMGRYFDAQLGIGRAILSAVNTHLAANPGDREKPNFKAGLPDIFGGVAQTFLSAITTLPTKGLTDAWRRERIPALAELAPHVAAVVDAADAKTVHEMTMQVADGTSDAGVKDGLRKIAAVFNR